MKIDDLQNLIVASCPLRERCFLNPTAKHHFDQRSVIEITPCEFTHVCSFSQNRDGVSQKENLIESMRDIQDADPTCLQAFNEFEQRLLFTMAERRCRLVEDHNVRVPRHGSGDFYHLPFPDTQRTAHCSYWQFQLKPIKEFTSHPVKSRAVGEPRPSDWFPAQEDGLGNVQVLEYTELL